MSKRFISFIETKRENMKNISVLGSGRVETAITIDLCNQHKVTAIDINQHQLEYLKDHFLWDIINTANRNIKLERS
jgi:3-hydroxyacyl-CoA dehydrogenase